MAEMDIEKVFKSEEDTPALTDWINEPSIKDLKDNFDDAKPDADAHKIEVSNWLDNMNLTGSARIKKKKGKSSVQPKLIRKQAEWRYSSLTEPFLSTPDLFNIEPTSAGDRNRAIQNQLVLNNQINTKLNKVKFVDEYIREAVDTGTVLVKVGWYSESQTIEVKEPIYEFIPDTTGELAESYAGMLQLRETDNEAYLDFATPGLTQALDTFAATGVAADPIQVGTEIVEKVVEIANRPSWEIIDTRNVVIDPTCDGDLDKSNFEIEMFKTSITELKTDGKYTNLDKIQIDMSSPLAHPDYTAEENESNFEFKRQDPRKKFVVYEYWGKWDINGDGVAIPIVAAWAGSTMIRLEKNPFPDQKSPFVKAVYMPRRRNVYGEPDGELLLDNQKITGAVTRGVIDLMGKSANSQTGLRKDLMDVTNKRKYKRGEDYEFNGSVDPRQAIYTHTYPEIPQSAYNMITMQNNEAESLTGVKAFNTGITGNSLGDNVSNGRSALDAASKREVGILRRLAEGILQIGRKFVAMNAEFMSEEEVVRITAKNFITIRRDDLAGNFDLRLTISTAEEDNQKAEELAFMLQTTGQDMDPGLRNIILSDIARLRKMPTLAKKIEEYVPEPDPMAIQKAQMEMQLLGAQIAKENALAMKHAAEAEASGDRGAKDRTQAELNLAKAGTEGGKSRDAHSTADLKDLDFLEQESGTKQERDLQTIDRKAEVDTAGTLLVNGSQPAASDNQKQ